MRATITTLCLAACTLGSVGFAQEKGTEQPQAAKPVAQQEHFEVHSLAKLRAVEIKNGDKAVGKIEDLILDPADGSIDFVVLSHAGGEARLLPWQSVRIQRKEMGKDDLTGSTQLTEEKLSKAPTCKPGQRIDVELERRAREAAGMPEERVEPRSAGSILCCAQKVKGSAVKGATDESIGKLDELLLDVGNGAVAFVVLNTSGGAPAAGDKSYALPWATLQFTTDANDKVAVASKLTKERLAKAPEYDAKDAKKMSSAAWLRELYTFHSVEPYWSNTQPASSPRGPEEKRKDGKP